MLPLGRSCRGGWDFAVASAAGHQGVLPLLVHRFVRDQERRSVSRSETSASDALQRVIARGAGLHAELPEIP